MDTELRLNEYTIEFKKILPNGILDGTYNKADIEATSKDAAIAALRTQLSSDGIFDIRINKINQKNIKQVVETTRKKRGIIGWIFVGIFIIGMIAKLANKLIN